MSGGRKGIVDGEKRAVSLIRCAEFAAHQGKHEVKWRAVDGRSLLDLGEKGVYFSWT